MMYSLRIAFAMIVLNCSFLSAQTKPENVLYLKQNPPGLIPTLFSPGLVSSKEHYEYGSVFSKDGKEFYYGVIINEKPQIRCIKFKDNAWTKPETVIGSDKFEYNDPFLSPD